MALERNVIAPIFNLKDVYGRMIDLETYKDKKILIAFFRHAGCPFCNIRVHNLTKIYDDLKPFGFEMIFFFESPERIILRSTFHQEVSPVPIISDPDKTWYDAYGLESSGMKSAISHITTFVQTAFKARALGLPMHPMAEGESIKTMPAEFLVDKGLEIKHLLYSQRLNERMDVKDIIKFAKGEQIESVA